MDFKNLDLSDFARYILTGINFILFVIIFPVIYLQPDRVNDLLAGNSFLSLSVLGIVFGYLLDILKIYHLTPRFKSNRQQFFKKISGILDIPKEEVSSYFSLTTRLSTRFGNYDLERRRSDWILTLHTAVTLILAIIIWGSIIVFEVWYEVISIRSVIPIIAGIISLLLSIRLFNIAERERVKLNQDFLIFLQKNKKEIVNSWKLIMPSGNDKKNANS
jgi:hypothetical protein